MTLFLSSFSFSIWNFIKSYPSSISFEGLVLDFSKVRNAFSGSFKIGSTKPVQITSSMTLALIGLAQHFFAFAP